MPIIHMVPRSDIQEHQHENDCPCGCKVTIGKSGDVICIHTAYDGREALEDILDDKLPPEARMDAAVEYFATLFDGYRTFQDIPKEWLTVRVRQVFTAFEIKTHD